MNTDDIEDYLDTMHGIASGKLTEIDMQRLRVGIETYGEPLTVHTAIDPLVYAYEEALDLACYLRQEIELRKRAAKNTGGYTGSGS